MFKRKKKEKYIEPIKPEPRVLKQWNNNRLVVTWVPQYSHVVVNNESSKIILYNSHLVLEKKDTNAMQEPFWIKDCEDPGPLNHNGYVSMYDPRDRRLMFQLFREMYL